MFDRGALRAFWVCLLGGEGRQIGTTIGTNVGVDGWARAGLVQGIQLFQGAGLWCERTVRSKEWLDWCPLLAGDGVLKIITC